MAESDPFWKIMDDIEELRKNQWISHAVFLEDNRLIKLHLHSTIPDDHRTLVISRIIPLMREKHDWTFQAVWNMSLGSISHGR